MRTATATASAVVAALAAVAFPGPAVAKKHVWGSDLEAPANKIEAHPSSSAFWHKDLPGDARVKVPARGRVSKVRLKGTAIKKNGVQPVTLFHFQVFHRTDDGKLRVSTTSGNFHVPVGGDQNQITTYKPVNLCARKGDFVAFSNVGGFKPGSYPNGTPFRVFSNVADSTTGFFTKGSGINNGNVFTPGQSHAGEELLMRITLLSGDDGGQYCQNH